MENASKALLMAGEVLIGIIVVSLLMIMVNSLTSYQQVNTQTQREAQIVQFNNQFEGYNRERVRGNEVYSLISKVIDYNKRRSTMGNGSNEEGNEIGFEPMTLIINFKENTKKFSMDGGNSVLFNAYQPKGQNMVIDGSERDAKNEMIGFDNQKISDDITIKGKVNEVLGKNSPEGPGGVTFQYTTTILENLVNAYDSLFNYNDEADFRKRNDEEAEKIKVIEDFNNAVGVEYFPLYEGSGANKKHINGENAVTYWKEYLTSGSINRGDSNNNIFRDVNVYYEYSQFLRALFKCTECEYNHDTGRVIKMTFEFTGKFD